MKLKSIIACGAILLGVGSATTSCEDMFTPDNALVSTELAPKDTLYHFMGIVKNMQKLADRTVLLGEIRADLVDLDPLHSSAYLQELKSNNISADNPYNKPADYYAVINNCNVFLSTVDSLKNSQGTRKYFEKEICSIKCFRAWCYLELVKNYGKVPLVTEPVLESDKAEDIVKSGNLSDMASVLTFCINDLEKYQYMDENQELRQKYGSMEYDGIQYAYLSLPVRIVLAELYLWRGSYTNSQSDYINAIRLYHDYFTFPKEERGTKQRNVSWSDKSFSDVNPSDHYNTNSFNSGYFDKDVSEAVIAMDTTSYYGNYADVNAVFNSTYRNSYYPAAVPSQRMRDISTSQLYCYYQYSELSDPILEYGSSDENAYPKKVMKGDLRYNSIYSQKSNFAESKYNSSLSPVLYNISKYGSAKNDQKLSYIPLYRLPILYLHLAEALNRAGFPETAFAILKYGISYYTLNDRSIISQDEFDRLCEIKSNGFSLSEPRYTGDMSAKANSTFVIWPSTVFYTQNKGAGDSKLVDAGASICQYGIHSFGSGDTEYNEYYEIDDEATKANLKVLDALPDTVELPKNFATAEDSAAWLASKAIYDAVVASNAAKTADNIAYLATPEVRAKRQAHVARLLLEEEALEGAYEGHRFYDIMRYQMQEKGGEGIGTTITMPDFYATEKVKGYDKETNQYVETDQLKYGRTDNMEGKPWYLALPKR